MNKLKVLVAENDTKVLFAFSKVLENEGCVCIKADSTIQALKEIKRTNPNAVFLDISRPGQDYEMIFKTISENKLTVPLVIISSHVTDKVRELAAAAGALQVIEKPLRVESVRQCLERIKAKIIEK